MNLDQDTIVAIATAPGRGGIGVVRLSGPAAWDAVSALVTLNQPQARMASFCRIVDPQTQSHVDEAVVTSYPSPHSYTGEDVVEIACHGSPVVLEFVVREAVARGARMARAGEFTQRAFLNGRLDLTQAEAVRDLIEASTLQQARLAAEQLGGAVSRRVAPVKEALVLLIATLEAGIDFAEDDIDVMLAERIVTSIAGVESSLQALADSFRYGRILNGGLSLAIVGEPNAGKSSLFNRLLDRDRAIVTATPGTTRDAISERVSIDGVPVDLIDTAGLRTTSDEAESKGIQKSHEALAKADLVLVVTNASRPLSAAEMNLLTGLEGRPFLLVRNKVDLATDDAEDGVRTSAITGEGIATLRSAIAKAIRQGATAEGGMLTNVRQHESVLSALSGLAAARAAVGAAVPHEMVLLDLYASLRALDELTGTTTPDDVLNLIFSTFCIGK